MNPHSTIENIKTVNSVIRTMLVLAFIGIVGWLGWLGYDRYVKPGLEAERIREEMAALQVRFEAQGKELEKAKIANKLLKIDHRKAVVDVLEEGVDESGNPWFDVRFVEVTPEGVPISEGRRFRLKGKILYVDAWVVKFEDKYIESSDALRGSSLCVFKGIWGDLDERDEHHPLDDVESGVDTAYGPLNSRSELEKQIWDDFWTIANNPQRRDEMGIRANHGTINYLKVEPGMTYELNLRASDGLTIKVTRDKNT